MQHKKYMSLSDLLVVMLFFIAANIGFSMGAKILTEKLGISLPATDLGYYCYIPVFLVTILFGILYRNFRCRAAGEQPDRIAVALPDPNFILLGVLYLAAISVLQEPMTSYMPESYDDYLNLFQSGTPWLGAVVGIVIAPVAEETLFRGILLSGLARRYGTRTAILLSSLAFSMVHPNLLQGGAAFISGLILGYIFIRTGRKLATVIFLHAINNLAAYFMLAFYKPGPPVGLQDFITSEWIYYGILTGAGALLAIFLIRFFTLRDPGKGGNAK